MSSPPSPTTKAATEENTQYPVANSSPWQPVAGDGRLFLSCAPLVQIPVAERRIIQRDVRLPLQTPPLVCQTQLALDPCLIPYFEPRIRDREFHRCTILMVLTRSRCARTVTPPATSIPPSGDPSR